MKNFKYVILIFLLCLLNMLVYAQNAVNGTNQGTSNGIRLGDPVDSGGDNALDPQIPPCPDDYDVREHVNAGQNDVQQAKNVLTANNVVENGATASYDAGDLVLLLPGFYARRGAVFSAYIDGCIGPFLGKFIYNETGYATNSEDNEIKVELFPNPANDVLNLRSSGVGMISWRLYSFDGQLVANSLSGQSEFHVDMIDVSSLRSGLYKLSVKLSDNSLVYQNVTKH